MPVKVKFCRSEAIPLVIMTGGWGLGGSRFDEVALIRIERPSAH